jgi:hypothetical protein
MGDLLFRSLQDQEGNVLYIRDDMWLTWWKRRYIILDQEQGNLNFYSSKERPKVCISTNLRTF